MSNIYLFTGSVDSPAWKNSANSNSSLNPNINLTTPGSYVIGFIGNNTPGSDFFIGINLFFNGDLARNRISAVAPNTGASSFSVISGATSTFGERGSNPAYSSGVPGSGSLSYTTGGLNVTLTAMSVLAPGSSTDLITFFSLGTTGNPDVGDNNHSPDTVGSMTLTVTTVPEPAGITAVSGIVAGVLVLMRRRTGRRAIG
ncbi:MAG: hypothetical protein PHQ04_10200 [Opitutaceae bacterium]|nr:hypothetical protein [Opitutaceae bacterium]